MTETVFKTTKSSIAVFRQMIDQANKEHETALKNLKNNYIGDMFIKMRDSENAEHKQRTDALRNAAYNEICGNIRAVREQISAKAKKREFKALDELSSLSGLKRSQSEFDLIVEMYANNNYWNMKKLQEIATEQGLNTSFEFAPMDQQLSALDELQENCRLFVFGANTETGETYNRWGHNQQFLGYGDTSKGNSYEQLLLTSDAEIERLENEYMAKNPLFSEDDFVADTIRGMSAIEGTTKQLHYLNNKIKNMTAEQKSEIVNRLSMSKSEDMRLVGQLCAYESIKTIENGEEN